jgi:hypothetical protein
MELNKWKKIEAKKAAFLVGLYNRSGIIKPSYKIPPYARK